MDEEDARWIEAMKAKGHSPRMGDDGELDGFVLNEDYHAGPGCAVCGWSTCWHCYEPENAPIPECNVIEAVAVAPAARLTAPGSEGETNG